MTNQEIENEVTSLIRDTLENTAPGRFLPTDLDIIAAELYSAIWEYIKDFD